MAIRKGASTEELKEHLRDKMEEIAGTRDLQEANRRASVLDDWRVENQSGGEEFTRAPQCSTKHCTKAPVQLVRYQDSDHDLYWCEEHQDSDAGDEYEWPKEMARW